jgi:hypothetical protein
VAGLVRLADAADGCIYSEWHTAHAATGMARPVARTAHVLMHEADADVKPPVQLQLCPHGSRQTLLRPAAVWL